MVGAGHAGLAMSRCLAGRGIDHVVLERGEVANSWRTERWDSLRLLTPNWQSRLPGFDYEGDDPDGFRDMTETIAFLDRYAEVIQAPVETRTTVTSIRRDDDDYVVATDKGEWRCRALVLATGACNVASLPKVAGALSADVASVHSFDYRNPDQLPAGGVLVVGASATGTQLGLEIHRSGRPVTLAVGEHIRVPRAYPGRDVMWWMDNAGVHDERWDEMDDINRARRVPSLQLTGTSDRSTLDLNAMTDEGVDLVGRFAGLADGRAQFSGSLLNQCALSDLKMNRLLNGFDEWATEAGRDGEVEPSHRLERTRTPEKPPLTLKLVDAGIRTVLWCTGYHPDLSWLESDILDRKGRIRHDGGVTPSPGLYLMGMQFLRRRKSALIDGAGDDARDLSAHLSAYLDGEARAASAG